MGGCAAEKSIVSRFGRLVVTEVMRPEKGDATVVATCDCGEIWRGLITQLRTGHTKSCGCLAAETTSLRAKTHGMSGSPEHSSWKSMLNRCYNVNGVDYVNYGGRGIAVCERWRHSFENFFADMGPRPSSKHSIDRIDSDGAYSPENCRWATPDIQGGNTRRTIKVEINGIVRSLRAWCVEYGVNYSTVRGRVASGQNPIDALVTPARPMPVGRIFEHDGLTMTLTEWSKMLGVGITTLSYRLKAGYPYSEVFKSRKMKHVARHPVWRVR